MLSSYEITAAALKVIFDTEFAVESITLSFDKIHESLGRSRVAAGVFPTEDIVSTSNGLVQESYLEVRLYGLWEDVIDPETVVNPTKIANYAERFRRALQASPSHDTGTPPTWYFQVTRVEYPDDPTGNKTRFHATVRAVGNNAGLVETIG